MISILVITHPYAGNDSDINCELINAAYDLSKGNGADVKILTMEKFSDKLIQLYQRYGGKNFLIYEAEQELEYICYVDLIAQVCRKYKPNLVLYPSTELGKDIAATMATILHAALIADCIDIQLLDEDKYSFSRTAMNDSIIAKIRCAKDCIQMCTVKRNVFEAKEVCNIGEENIEFISPDKATTDNKVPEILEITENVKTVRDCQIENARIIFGIGRGVLKDDIKKVEDLAKVFHAEIACTRIIVEEQIMDKARQIGQSGKMVSPDIYVAFGISGASQHMVGLKNAKKIIAINHDREAMICKYADYVFIADTHKFITCMHSNFVGD